MTDRAIRALEDVVAVEEMAPGMVRVVTWSDQYVVDSRDGGCYCPDKKHNDAARCKHDWAAILADVDDLPAPYLTDTESRPTALPDGGDECEDCAELPGDWECWPCAAANDIGVDV